MKNLALFFLTFVFSLNIYANTVSDKEKDALIKFYHATNGSHWKIKWNLALSVSTWYGVQIENGKVVAINLADNNLKGELPFELGELKNLEILCLSKNELQGNLPGSLYTISTLKILLLNNNKFSGNLSPEIINFQALQNLSLFDNNFEGGIPKELEKLHNLSEMNLSYNHFKGSASKDLISLDALNMTMFDENGNPFLIEINTEKETTLITKNE
ncbi:Two component regulator three Y domain protein [Flavobacterium sp. ANB]|uniref:Two component regulator three Y domain protein n=1 Tax=unclassified Flavobacterium TaxID=196869 RepID=UPI0012B72BD7|nr:MULTISPECIES: Two component regulator three Y domain protein [unclassified Flavobacterium]MBF4518707.1 Two component regulator three Y domain protein [Flavobacterium sp. ANB]MTD67788.1 Two component regulator three Y domain protein [Flavobacterium sp. LC2016-13]